MDSGSPVTVSGLSDATAITAGRMHSCAVVTDGTARCWGYNGLGQLGDGTHANRSVPAVVTNLFEVVGVAAGGFHTCALLNDGTARCWGENSAGQLGNGTTLGSTIPTSVLGLSNIAEVATHQYHTCALLDDGNARCWGEGIGGRIGDGFAENRLVPTVVANLTGVSDIAPGGQHSCAATLDGTVRCWGQNALGQLGDGTTTVRLTPTRAFYAVAFGLLAAGVRRTYRIAPAKVEESKDQFRRALDETDAALEKSAFLAGDALTRADVTVASLLAPLCRPPEHVVRWPSDVPPALEAFRREHEQRPTYRHVLRMYRDHRRPAVA